MSRACKNCGQPFAGRGGSPFCDRTCQSQWQEEQAGGWPNPETGEGADGHNYAVFRGQRVGPHRGDY